MNKFLCFLLALLCIHSHVVGGNTLDYKSDSLEKARIGKPYFKSYLLDTKDMCLAPLHWKGRQWIITGTVLGAAAGIISQDDKIQKWSQEVKTGTWDTVTKYGFEPWGSGYYSMSVMGLYYIHGLVFKNERSKKTALLGVKAYILSGIAVNIPKLIINRYRPYHGESPDPYAFKGPFAGDFYKSMPSGHTTSIFTVATIVAEEYKDYWFVPVTCYTIASAAGISRIIDNKHWASDVFVGAAFGWAMGKLIHSRNNWGLRLTPHSNFGETGMKLTLPIGNKKG